MYSALIYNESLPCQQCSLSMSRGVMAVQLKALVVELVSRQVIVTTAEYYKRDRM